LKPNTQIFELTPLPPGWAWTTLPALIPPDGVFIDGDWVESKDQDAEGGVRLIQLADVGDGMYRNRSHRHLTHQKAQKLRCTFLEVGDVLIARMPDPLGRACLFPGDSKPCVTVVDVCIVRTGKHGVDNRWLMYTVNSPQFRASIAAEQSGSTRKRISRGNLAKLELPLPPLPEQRRIVAKIEELFSKLDAGVEALKKVKAELKRYRQAVLKYAFEGKLTEEWREAHNGELEPASVLLERIKEERKKKLGSKYKDLPPLDTSDLPPLPEGWVWVPFSSVVDKVSATNKKLKVSDYLPAGKFPVIDQGQKYIGGYTNREELKLVVSEPVLVFGDHTKAVKYVEFDFVVGADGVKVLKPAPCFDPKLLYYFLRILQLPEKGYARHFQFLEKSFLPLPPLAEQQQIVSEIERRFSVADEVEKVVEQSLKQAERLRQSILKRAFEGKLVPQDPTDEPASVLLERIKKEKERQTAKDAKKRKGK
jgi:type I restriction enzyme S subunit